MAPRSAIAVRMDPGRFRCLVCKRYVTGTASGHCPHCGFVPPSAPVVRDGLASVSGTFVLAAMTIALAILVVLRG